MKYSLLQAPIAVDDYSGQIVIVDSATRIGKKKIEACIDLGYCYVGEIESELQSLDLMRGFCHKCNEVIKKIGIIHDHCDFGYGDDYSGYVNEEENL